MRRAEGVAAAHEISQGLSSHISESNCHERHASFAMRKPPLVAIPMSIAYKGQARSRSDRPVVRLGSTPHQAVLESQEERQQQWQLLILAKEVWRRDAALAPRERGRAHISVRILFGTNQALIRPALDAAHL